MTFEEDIAEKIMIQYEDGEIDYVDKAILLGINKYKQKVKDVLSNEHNSREDCYKKLFGDEK